MQYQKLGNSELKIAPLILGTWAFGGGSWWGPQDDKNTVEVLEAALKSGISALDTAPMYGKGRSERVIGDFIKKRKNREKIILATKVGLSWQGPRILHDLSKKRILEELDQSRLRLQSDFIDLYQIHWPDPKTPIGQSAEVLHSLFQKGLIKAIGVSNYSVEQMSEFLEYAPLHSLQPQYSMFERGIEDSIVDFCLEKNIGIITYAPLYSGILTGKFFFDNVKIPDDTNRKMKTRELIEPRLSINKTALSQLKEIAKNYNKNLSQLAINWNFSQKGISAAIVGMRKISQLEDNLGSLNWQISNQDLIAITKILNWRQESLSKLKE